MSKSSNNNYMSSDITASKQKTHVFNTIFSQIKFEVIYDEMWEGEYLEDLILGDAKDMPNIPIGKMSKCISPEGRRFIFIGTRLGTVTIASTEDYYLYSFPEHKLFDMLLYKEVIGLPDHKHILGWNTNKNIGIVIEEMAIILAES